MPFIAGSWCLDRYTGPVGALVRRAKYRPDPGAADELGNLLASAAAGRLPTVDVVTHVPVPRRRKMRRGFDQADRLARPVARALGVPMRSTLTRSRAVEQAGLDEQARERNARGAFRAEHDPGRRVLIIDDVLTTGATARACAIELLGAGADRVYLLTAAHAASGFGRTLSKY